MGGGLMTEQLKEKTMRKMPNENLWYCVIHSPDDGGWYSEIVNCQGKTVWTGMIHETEYEANLEALGSADLCY